MKLPRVLAECPEHAFGHGLMVRHSAKTRAVGPEVVTQGLELRDGNVIVPALTHEREELIQYLRKREKRGPRVEAIPCDAVGEGLTPGSRLLLEDIHLPAPSPQNNSGGKPPKPGAYHGNAAGLVASVTSLTHKAISLQ